MAQNKKLMMYLRRSIQVLFFLLIPGLFIQTFQSIKAIILFLVHGQGTFNGIVINIVLLMIISAVTAMVGRFFCGWMCAFGSMGDLIYKLSHIGQKNPKKYLLSADSVLKWVKYVLLAFIVIFIWGFQIITVPTGVNPWDLFGMLASFGDWPSFSDLIQGWIPAALLLLAIMAGSVFVERFFCRYLCPLGAYFGIISRFRQLIIVKKKENCGQCTLCTQKCSMGIDLNKVDKVHDVECINCMECTLSCPRSNAHMELSGSGVNAVVAGTLSVTLMAGAYYLGNYFDSNLSGSTAESTTNVATGIAADLADGTYEGTGNGFRGETTVSVEVESGIITNITIASTGDDAQYMNRASGTVISEILAAQDTNVDTVTGATFSSNGIISAVEDAIHNGTSVVATTDDTSTDTTDDTTTETKTDSTTDTTTDATTETTTDSTTNNTTTNGTTTTPTEAETTTTEAATTTTASSGAFQIADGTYEGSGTGFRGTTTVSVTVENGSITTIDVVSYSDDAPYFNRAKSTVISEIIDQQTVTVDAVSGATYSSNGIMDAVADALGVDFTSIVSENSRHGH